jgi:hypothetical protein
MANLQDLRSLIEVQYPNSIYEMSSKEGIVVDDIKFTKTATPEDKAAIQAIIDSFDWNAAPPDITGFFDALGKAIVIDQSLPADVYIGALILRDQKELKYQQVMLQALALNPAYTKEQKQVLNTLLKQYNLLLPEVDAK